MTVKFDDLNPLGMQRETGPRTLYRVRKGEDPRNEVVTAACAKHEFKSTRARNSRAAF